MADALIPPVLSIEASSATLAEPLKDFSAMPVPMAREDETAPPPQPVTQRERIPTIDVVRGVALMGILLMNIASFSGPIEMYVNPLIVGHHRTYDLVAWSIRWVLFEGKMRAAFSMLFGAGVILLTERAERSGSRNIADIFLRRNMWLVLFGVLHFYFIWMGDILYWYGLTALLFLYPCRHVRFRNLLIAGALVLVIGSGSDAYFAIDGIRERNRGQEAQALANAGKKLTTDQQDALKKWNETLDKRKKDHEDDLKAMRGSYLDQLKWHAQWGPKIQAYYFYTFGFTDALGMMLIGMGLYRIGFLTGGLSYKWYGWIIAAGFLLGIPINGLEAMGLIRDNFEPESGWYVLYQAGRLSGAVAIVALVVVMAKAGLVPWLAHRVAAVGQTALSNYLLTSISCTLLFSRYGLGLYGKLEYYQIYAIVAGVWALNLILSPVWLRYYRFGPMEWVWRSLTYWKRQPMKRQLAEEQALAA
ncbi:MAG TPA: DUF418 domain-containing protein [Terracidiphilus sp.]